MRMSMPFHLSRHYLYAVFLLPILMLATAMPAHAGSTYGKTLVKVSDLPLSDIARFERFNLSPTNSRGEPKQQRGQTTEYEVWQSAEEMELLASQGPYTFVVKTHGIGTADGDASVRWYTGWGAEPSTMALGTVKKVKVNEPVDIVSASPPQRFRKNLQVYPSVAFVRASNMRVDRVQIEIWSGVGETSFISMIGPLSGVITGLTMIGLIVWFRRS